MIQANPSMSQTEISNRLGIGRSTVHRIIKVNGIGKELPRHIKLAGIVNGNKRGLTKEFVDTFEDLEKVSYLVSSIQYKNHNRDAFPYTKSFTEKFLTKFYHDPKFNKLYSKWKETGDKLMKPSLDHIVPVDIGGSNELTNLQFLSILENRAKGNAGPDVWENIRNNIVDYLV